MRLPSDVFTRCVALGLTALLAGCGAFGGGTRADIASAAQGQPSAYSKTGPEADYPSVLGDPYSIGGVTYTPVDTLNFDQVGYAAIDAEGGNSVTVSHRTLPMPSYIEVTSLETGKTILARVERRGPMSGTAIVALSQGASAQLGIGEGAAVRVRRVNPPEEHREKLRLGERAPDRIDTPKSLLAVLQRKLETSGGTNLAAQSTNPQNASGAAPVRTASVAASPPARVAAAAPPAAMPKAAAPATDTAFANVRKAVTDYPLAPLTGSRVAAVPPAPVTPRVAAPTPAPVSQPAATIAARPKQDQSVSPDSDGKFVIQAAAFSSKANADRMANSIDGFVEKSGNIYRVRKGPFASRGQAEAALAKVREAGYKDARVYSAG